MLIPRISPLCLLLSSLLEPFAPAPPSVTRSKLESMFTTLPGYVARANHAPAFCRQTSASAGWSKGELGPQSAFARACCNVQCPAHPSLCNSTHPFPAAVGLERVCTHFQRFYEITCTHTSAKRRSVDRTNLILMTQQRSEWWDCSLAGRGLG